MDKLEICLNAFLMSFRRSIVFYNLYCRYFFCKFLFIFGETSHSYIEKVRLLGIGYFDGFCIFSSARNNIDRRNNINPRIERKKKINCVFSLIIGENLFFQIYFENFKNIIKWFPMNLTECEVLNERKFGKL